MPVSTPRHLHHQCSCPHSESHLHLPPQQALQDLEVSLVQDPFSGFQCTWYFVCTLHVWSFCFTQSCGVHVINPDWPSQPDSLGAIPSDATPRPPRLKSHVWGSELSLLWEIFWDIIILHFVDNSQSGVSCVFLSVLMKGDKPEDLLLYHLFHPPNDYCSKWYILIFISQGNVVIPFLLFVWSP